MSPSVVLLAVPPGDQSVTEIMAAASAIEALARCIRLLVPSAANKPKSRFNLAAISRFTAGTATPSPDNT